MPQHDAARKTGLLGQLQTGLQQMDIELSLDQHDALIEYLFLLERWNRVHNLTAVRDIKAMVGRHLLDSLSLLPFLFTADERENEKGPDRITDLGSGAGLPGIPLAIARPDVSCLMIDSSARKTRFIQQALASLKIRNAEVLHARVRNVTSPLAECVVARAFSSPVDIMRTSGHLCAPGGKMMFMMGHMDNHFQKLPENMVLEAVHEVSVADSTAARHIVVCTRRVAGS